MKKDISNNYVVIQGFMIESLGLKSNELFTYALIYGFCQDKDSEFTGSVSYICTWLSCSKNTALKCIKSLIKKGLIKKEVEFKNGLTFNHYTVDFSKINQNCMGGAKTEQGVQKETNRGAKTEPGGGAKTEPNNTINNKDNNNTIYSPSNDVQDTCLSFIDFWDLYNKKVGRKKVETKYSKISEDDRLKIMITVRDYVKYTPDTQFRKDPYTYINGEHWNDDLTVQKQRYEANNKTDINPSSNNAGVKKSNIPTDFKTREHVEHDKRERAKTNNTKPAFVYGSQIKQQQENN